VAIAVPALTIGRTVCMVRGVGGTFLELLGDGVPALYDVVQAVVGDLHLCFLFLPFLFIYCFISVFAAMATSE